MTDKPQRPKIAATTQNVHEILQYATLSEIVAAAESKLPSDVWNFIAGGAGDEYTLRSNVEAFRDWEFRPRMMTGIRPPDMATTFLDFSLSMPVFISPFGYDGLIHPDGAVAISKAASALGTIAITPQMATYSLEEVAKATIGGGSIFSISPIGSPELFLRLSRRAARAGFRYLCVTVDSPVPAWRDRAKIDRFNPPQRFRLGNYKDDADITSLHEHALFTGQRWTWMDLARVCQVSPIPWIAKGILTGEDARHAVDAGAAAIIVSNHGGRELDGVPATLRQLPEVLNAVGGEVPVAVDGGIRRGADVVKALSLGASAVGIARLPAFGLAADGEAGVRRVIEIFRAEIFTAMGLLGRDEISQLDRSCLSSSTRTSL